MSPARVRLTTVGRLTSVDIETPWRHWFFGGFTAPALALAWAERFARERLGRRAVRGDK